VSVLLTGDKISLALPQLRTWVGFGGDERLRHLVSTAGCLWTRSWKLLTASSSFSLSQVESCQILSSSYLLGRFLPGAACVSSEQLGAVVTPTLVLHAGPAISLIFLIVTT